ncbi:MAG: Hsp20/alpha crystallin family protein [Chloroflexi bacterium]|nr:Hsp20/alpha crystallin family protein [Chloroflexota bacterium]
MNTIVRWNPSRSLLNEFDRLFNAQVAESDAPHSWGLPLDVIEAEAGYTVRASVPGIQADDLNVTLEKNVLTIQGEVSSDEQVDDARYHLRERRYGRFSRSLRFPVEVNAEAIEATYENGVLTLNVPKSEAVKPKQINVKVNAQ